jgi:nicotinamide mononucleotide transporter
MLEALLHAARPLLAPAFTAWGTPVTWLELTAVALSLGMVACNLRVLPLAWPLSIAASLAYALLFADARLYGQAALQFVFIAVASWGWWQWLHGRDPDGGALRVGWMSPRARALALAATLAAWPLLAWALHLTGDAAAPLLDALPTVGAVTAQLLLARKRVENWPGWLAVNLLSVALFVQQALWATALLYAVFAALSLAGWRAWALRARMPSMPELAGSRA